MDDSYTQADHNSIYAKTHKWLLVCSRCQHTGSSFHAHPDYCMLACSALPHCRRFAHHRPHRDVDLPSLTKALRLNNFDFTLFFANLCHFRLVQKHYYNLHVHCMYSFLITINCFHIFKSRRHQVDTQFLFYVSLHFSIRFLFSPLNYIKLLNLKLSLSRKICKWWSTKDNDIRWYQID